MRTHLLLFAALLTAGALSAQSPLTTGFAGGIGLGSGATTYFDVDAKVDLDITAVDCNFLGAAGGVAATINVWTIPGSHVGSIGSSNGWTLQATANATTAPSGSPTNFVFTTPIALSQGIVGIAIEHLGDGPSYTNGTVAGALWSSNNELDLFEGAATATAFTGSPFSPRVWNGAIHYSVASGFANSTPFGDGCGETEEFSSFYELASSPNYDFGGTVGVETVYSLTNTGTGLMVMPGSSAWFPPTSSDLGLGDDTIGAAQPLGFTLNYTDPAGTPRSTSDIWICANGYILLENPTGKTLGDFSPTAAELLSQEARLCPAWQDLQSTVGGGGGTVHFDIDPASGDAVVTWLAMEEWATPAATHTFQAVISPSDNIEFRYQDEFGSTAGGTNTIIVGYSTGNGALDPGSVDISASTPIVTEPDLFVPNLGLATDRPVEGTTMTATVHGIPAGTVVGVVVLSSTQILPGVQPTPGLGSCLLYVGLDDLFYFFPTGATEMLSFPIAASGFAGMTFELQSITFSPGINSAGIATSNGVSLLVDAN